MLKSRRCLGLLVLLVAVAASSVASAQPPTITLENGRSVPTRAAFLEVAASGGQGDCDLYVRHGQYPTSREHDFRSIGPTTADRVRIERPRAGLWYVLVFGGGNYANVSLRAHFPVPGGGPVRVVPLTNNVVQYGLSGGTGSADFF